MIIREDRYYMRLAIEEAGLAFLEGEVPVGAVLVNCSGELIAKAHNRREALNDPIAHAEMIVLKEGSRILGNWRLTGTTLYVTKEPCLMCAGAIINSRVERVVYGCADPKGGVAGSLYNVLTDRRFNHQVKVTSGVLAEEAASLLVEFFRRRR